MSSRAISCRFVLKNCSPFFLNFSSSSSSSSAYQSLQKQQQQQQQQLSYDLTTCIASLQACALHNNLTKGKKLHSYILKHDFFTSPLSITSLVNMYSKCNRITNAVSVLDSSVQYRSVYAWNTMISGFIANGLLENGFRFYQKMRREGVIPDKLTFPCVIKACLECLEVKKIHGLVFKFGLELDVYIGSALVNCYLKFGLMEETQKVFEELPERDDVVLWNTMINGYAQIGQLDMVLEIFSRMSEQWVVPNRFTVTGFCRF